MKKTIILAILVLTSLSLKSQEDKLGAWFIYNGFFDITPKFEFFAETQLRTYEFVSHPEAFFIRGFYSYNLVEDFQIGFSTEYHKHFEYAENQSEQTYREEFRMTLQAYLFQKLNAVSISHRYRYEFRNINSFGGNRMRYRVQVTIPIVTKESVKGNLFLNTNNEFFINNQPEFSFDQNRFFVALGYYFTKSLNLQLGYLLVSRDGENYNRLQIFLTQKVDFYN